jgi:hypothetical protein
MPVETFAAAGLEKLSEEELAALEAWFAGRMVEVETSAASGEKVPEGDDAFGLEMIPERIAPLLARDSGSIESRILGKFKGWRRKGEIFNLENGQVWRQAEAGEFYISTEDPEVMIIRGLFGAYYLQVDGYSTRVRVTRVK